MKADEPMKSEEIKGFGTSYRKKAKPNDFGQQEERR